MDVRAVSNDNDDGMLTGFSKGPNVAFLARGLPTPASRIRPKALTCSCPFAWSSPSYRRDEAEAALQMDDLSSECHKWFAVLTGLTSHYESMHGKLKSSHIFKEHIDRAIILKADDPWCFYLLGRWCYEVASLGWLEKKAAAALYETPPNATLQDALDNFLKAEELSPGFSRTARLYIAKCHKDLGNISQARNWAELAFQTPKTSYEDGDSSSLEEALEPLGS
ncbi:hypothetical protein JZ751_002878 [Albula glossodonta]|uniref:Regulator of microtubule dynamics protein 3 n=1 Tax=Albula glossodonta TaxID=121402 RepID=A0A8T2NCJ6_9TELE|nr:hypothetical protein JZ751_002878 [Albula glossodonta]